MSRSHPYKPEADKNRIDHRDPAHERHMSAVQSTAGWARALQTPCERHDAPEGLPCWSWEGEDGADHAGLCGRRARIAGLVRPAAPSRVAGAPTHPNHLHPNRLAH